MNSETVRAHLLEHARSKKNGIFPSKVNFESQLTNPICGDHVHIKALVENNIIRNIGFATSGCAICAASASLLCQEIQGLSLIETIDLGLLFEESLCVKNHLEWPNKLQGLSSFQHLRENPARKTCALLPHIALRTAIKRSES